MSSVKIVQEKKKLIYKIPSCSSSSCSGLFFEKHLKFIKLGEEFVDFTKKDLSYLMKDAYDDTFLKHVYETPVVTFEEVRRGQLTIRTPVRIQYNTKDQYRRAAKMLGLMDDFKVRMQLVVKY